MDTPSSEEKYSSPKPPAGKAANAGGAPPPLSTSLQRAAQPQSVQYVTPAHEPSPHQEPAGTGDGIPALDLTAPTPRWPEQTAISGKTIWRVATIAALAIVVVAASVLAFNLLRHGAAATGVTSVKTSSTATPNMPATATTLANAAASATVAATATIVPTLTPLPATATALPPTATPRPAIAFDNGFTAPNLMRLNGKASFNGASLRLTHSDGGEISSAYYTTPTYIGAFTTTFTYQALNAYADGFTFIVQDDAPTAIGNGAASSPSAKAWRSYSNSITNPNMRQLATIRGCLKTAKCPTALT